MAKKEIAVAEENPLAMTDKPSYIQDSGRGQENVGMEDLTIPRLDIAQAISPQVDKNEPEYIEGIEVGDMFNTVSKTVYGPKVLFVPVFFRKEWVIWKDRKKGGGFKGAYPTEHDAQVALQNMEDGDDCDIIDTAQHFGMVIDPASTAGEPAIDEIVVSMSKSKMKVSRQFNTLIKMAGGDRFSRIYEINTIGDQNANGDKYQNYSIKALGYVTEAMYNRAIELYEAISSGQRDVARDEHGANATNGGGVSNDDIVGGAESTD